VGCLKDPRVGFKDVVAQSCLVLGNNLIALCPRASVVLQQPRHPLSWKLLRCERGSLVAALKPHSCEKVMTSTYKNNPEKAHTWHHTH